MEPQRILKFPLEITDYQVIGTGLYGGVETVLVSEQKGRLCLWLQGYPTQEKQEIYRIRIFGTGHDIPQDEGLIHLGSVSMSDGFVWHVFRMGTSA